jgi:hypothetical protein
MKLRRKLLEAVNDARTGPQQKVVVDVIHAVRARGRRLTQALDQLIPARLKKNDFRLPRDNCLNAVLRVIRYFLGGNRTRAGAIYQIVDEATGAGSYQRLGP